MSEQVYIAEQFETEAQQREAAQLGMWIFLASEVMLFGGLFMGILVYRTTYWAPLQTATEHLHYWLGTINTGLLLTSGLTMAFAVLTARDGSRRRTFGWLILTAAIGIAFLGVKSYEYYKEYHEGFMPGVGPEFPLDVPAIELFYNLYFVSTGLHYVHLSCGIVAVLVMAGLVATRRLELPAREMPIEGLGMYWGLVDMIWIMLYAAIYLL